MRLMDIVEHQISSLDLLLNKRISEIDMLSCVQMRFVCFSVVYRNHVINSMAVHANNQSDE